jgi:hypothetical protein
MSCMDWVKKLGSKTYQFLSLTSCIKCISCPVRTGPKYLPSVFPYVTVCHSPKHWNVSFVLTCHHSKCLQSLRSLHMAFSPIHCPLHMWANFSNMKKKTHSFSVLKTYVSLPPTLHFKQSMKFTQELHVLHEIACCILPNLTFISFSFFLHTPDPPSWLPFH